MSGKTSTKNIKYYLQNNKKNPPVFYSNWFLFLIIDGFYSKQHTRATDFENKEK